MTKQSNFTLVRLLHFVRNDVIISPVPSSPSAPPLVIPTSPLCHSEQCHAELDSVLIQHFILDPEINSG